MSDGYYDPHPTVTLDRPLALIGFVESDVEHVGRLLSSVTGLRFATLDTLVEHAVGASRAEYVVAEGEPAWRARESEALTRALADRPPGVLVLGEGALLARANRRQVRQRARLVYVHRPVEETARRLMARGRERPELGVVRSLADLRTLLRARAGGYAEAEIRVEGGERAALPIARELARLLGWSVL